MHLVETSWFKLWIVENHFDLPCPYITRFYPKVLKPLMHPPPSSRPRRSYKSSFGKEGRRAMAGSIYRGGRGLGLGWRTTPIFGRWHRFLQEFSNSTVLHARARDNDGVVWWHGPTPRLGLAAVWARPRVQRGQREQWLGLSRAERLKVEGSLSSIYNWRLKKKERKRNRKEEVEGAKCKREH